MEGEVDKVFVVQGVANKLWATEDAIDAAIVQASSLMGGLVEARVEIGCSHIVTDPAMAKIAAALSAMAEARTALIESHHALNEAKLRIGVRTTLVGGAGSGDDDHKKKSVTDSFELRQVG
jgi:hypothetical protein